jgi:ferrous iron transport protein B
MRTPADNLRAGRRTITVAICGNPNCGKSTIFNAITGLRQQVGNYPGVTVERTTGRFSVDGFDSYSFQLLDIPGTYSLAAYSPDEYIAAGALFGKIEGEPRPDIAVCVVDATNLERSLYFVYQVVQTGAAVVVALNMMDLLTDSGQSIDTKLLSKELGGLPVLPIVASQGRGITELKAAIAQSVDRPVQPMIDPYGPNIQIEIDNLRASSATAVSSPAEMIRVLLDEGGPAERDFVKAGGPDAVQQLEKSRHTLRKTHGALSSIESSRLSEQAAKVTSQVLSRHEKAERSLTDRIDTVVLHPVAGLIILAGVMLVMFQSIFTWAEPLMGLIDSAFGALAGWIGPLITEGPLRSLVVDGMIGGVGSVLAFLPQIVILFVFISMLEDSGYMPRAAFLVDRAFGWCGLSGKSLIPMLSSFACAVPGIMATRTIENRRQRILTIIVSPLMSCSARLPVYTIMIAAFIPNTKVWGFLGLQGLVLGSLYLLGMITAILIALLVRLFVFKGQRGSFLMEMPTYKRPTLSSVGIRVYTRAKSFVLRAGTVIFAITIIIWALSYYPHSDSIKDDYAARRVQVERVSATSNPASAAITNQLAQINGEEAGAYLRDSYFGRLGRWIEPVFVPLGWDWKITMAALASFPAREVVVATLGTIYNLGSDAGAEEGWLVDKLRGAKWERGPQMGQPVFTPAVALSIMVFFALCCQCGATLVTIRQETGNWWYPALVFVYMTTLAYLGSLAVYQLFSGISV